jgi:hypothetical protein
MKRKFGAIYPDGPPRTHIVGGMGFKDRDWAQFPAHKTAACQIRL